MTWFKVGSKQWSDLKVCLLRYGVQPGTIVKVSCLSDAPASDARAEEAPAEPEAQVSHPSQSSSEHDRLMHSAVSPAGSDVGQLWLLSLQPALPHRRSLMVSS